MNEMLKYVSKYQLIEAEWRIYILVQIINGLSPGRRQAIIWNN